MSPNVSRTASTADRYSADSRNSRLFSASSTLAENFSGLLFCGWIVVVGTRMTFFCSARTCRFSLTPSTTSRMSCPRRVQHLLGLLVVEPLRLQARAAEERVERRRQRSGRGQAAAVGAAAAGLRRGAATSRGGVRRGGADARGALRAAARGAVGARSSASSGCSGGGSLAFGLRRRAALAVSSARSRPRAAGSPRSPC